MPNNLEFTTKAIHRPVNSKLSPVHVEEETMIIDQTGEGAEIHYQEIGTSEETISLSSDIASKGTIVIKNVDDTNYVDYGFSIYRS